MLRVRSAAWRTRPSRNSSPLAVASTKSMEKSATENRIADASASNRRTENTASITLVLAARTAAASPSIHFQAPLPVMAHMTSSFSFRFSSSQVRSIVRLGWHLARKEHGEQAAILILPKNLEHHLLPLAKIGQGPMQPVERVHAVVIDLDNHVSLREADVFGKTSRLHFGYKDAGLTLHSEMPCPFRSQRFGMEAKAHRRIFIGGLFLFIRASRKDTIPGFDRDVGLHFLAVPHVIDPHFASDIVMRNSIDQIAARLHAIAVDLRDHISGLKSRSRRRAARLHSFDDNSIGSSQFLQHDRICTLFVLEGHTD